HPGSVAGRNGLEERDAVPFGWHHRLDRGQVDRLADGVTGRHCWASLDAQPAPGAILDVDLQRVATVRQPGSLQRRRPETLWCTVQTGRVVVPGADHAVRADEAAVATLDAQVGVPERDQLGDVALLVRRGA